MTRLHVAVAAAAVAFAVSVGGPARADDSLAGGMKAEVLTLAATKEKEADAESSLKAATQAVKLNYESYMRQHDALQAQMNAGCVGSLPEAAYNACMAKLSQLQQIDAQNWQSFRNTTEADRAKVQSLPAQIAAYDQQIDASKAKIALLRSRLLQAFPNCSGSDEAVAECAGMPFTGGQPHQPLSAVGNAPQTRFFSVPTNGRPAVVQLSKQFDVLETQRATLARQLDALAALSDTPQNHVARARLKQQISNIEARQNYLLYKARTTP